ncbi:MAG: ABC transporter substrate-binding protein, partial [Candidatus Methylomirabilaceae bacterium]
MTGHGMQAARATVIVVAMALLGIAVATRVWGGDTTDRVRQELDRIAAVVKDPALRGADREGERKAKVKPMIVQWFDVQEMARRSLAAHWEKRSAQERAEFVG